MRRYSSPNPSDDHDDIPASAPEVVGRRAAVPWRNAEERLAIEARLRRLAERAATGTPAEKRRARTRLKYEYNKADRIVRTFIEKLIRNRPDSAT